LEQQQDKLANAPFGTKVHHTDLVGWLGPFGPAAIAAVVTVATAFAATATAATKGRRDSCVHRR